MNRLHVKEVVIDVPGRSGGRPLALQIEPGQVWGVLGPNGAGKTTLLHTLAGLRSPRSGEIHLNGQTLTRLSRRAVARQLGLVFQERQDGFPATVLETVMIGRHPYLSPWRMESADDIRLAREALTRLDVAHLESRLVSTLSGGERQRVAIATVLAQAPQLWLADEPTNHLDLRHQATVLTLLTEQAAAGCGVLMCLHDLNLAAHWCDHLLLLYPDGDACWGPTRQMLDLTALERLYGHPLATAEIDGTPIFIPRKLS